MATLSRTVSPYPRSVLHHLIEILDTAAHLAVWNTDSGEALPEPYSIMHNEKGTR
jgi:hypothetical protein